MISSRNINIFLIFIPLLCIMNYRRSMSRFFFCFFSFVVIHTLNFDTHKVIKKKPNRRMNMKNVFCNFFSSSME